MRGDAGLGDTTAGNSVAPVHDRPKRHVSDTPRRHAASRSGERYRRGSASSSADTRHRREGRHTSRRRRGEEERQRATAPWWTGMCHQAGRGDGPPRAATPERARKRQTNDDNEPVGSRRDIRAEAQELVARCLTIPSSAASEASPLQRVVRPILARPPTLLDELCQGTERLGGGPKSFDLAIDGQSNAVRHPQCRSGTCLEGSDAPRHDFASALPDAARHERCLPKGDLADGDAPRYGPERRDGAPSRRACRLAREPNHSLVVLFHGGDDTAKVDETETVPGCDDRATRETSQQAKRPNDTKFSGERSESAATRC